MNNNSKNVRANLGWNFKAQPQEKTWEAIHMRLENKKLRNRMLIYKKLSIAALFTAVFGVVVLFYTQNSRLEVNSFAQKSTDNFEMENWNPSAEANIYNMSDLKGLKSVYEGHKSTESM